MMVNLFYLQIWKSYYNFTTFDMKKLSKIALFGILVQSAGLIYGIVNKAQDIIIMCLIFMFVSCLPLFDKKK